MAIVIVCVCVGGGAGGDGDNKMLAFKLVKLSNRLNCLFYSQ